MWKLGYISPRSLGLFRSLLLPEVADAIEQEAAITALGLTANTVACGALAGYVEDGVFHIASLYLAPAYRRQGGGRQLLETLRGLLLQAKFTQRELFGMSLDFTATREEHETLAPFLSALGFSLQDDKGENIYLSTLAEASPALSGPLTLELTPFSQLSDAMISLAGKDARLAGVPLLPQPLDRQELDRDLSLALVQQGKVVAFVLFDFSCCGHLTLSSFWGGKAGPVVPPMLLRGALARAKEKYPPDTTLATHAVNRISARLVRQLLPQARPISQRFFSLLTADAFSGAS